jgi:hypothetical protein
MLTRPVAHPPGPAALPGGVVFEPEYEGHYLIVLRDGGQVMRQSHNGRGLTVAFPEIAFPHASVHSGAVRTARPGRSRTPGRLPQPGRLSRRHCLSLV